MTTISYQRANGLFQISSERGDKRVTEDKLRAIGDMDITECAERAKESPYIPQVLTFHRHHTRFA